MSTELAIIIPYYKNNFVLETFLSIQAQTNQNFNLYIGDDNSPNAIQPQLDKLDKSFRERIIYHRFTENLGSKSLTKQWERCIALSKNEVYIWLFSDDDTMPNDAVQRFYDVVKTPTPIQLFRFNINIIDNEGKVIGSPDAHPEIEAAENFVNRRLRGKCMSTACEYIFTKEVFLSKNKFVDFPLAWCSDDATWVNFSEGYGIRAISGKPVLWRMSGLNISSESEKSYQLKFAAAILYLKFLRTKFKLQKQIEFEWLLGQLYLVGQSTKFKKEFKSQVNKSGLFSKGFILKSLFLKRSKRIFFVLKTKFKN